MIRRLAEENQGWGDPKIHSELLKLGFVSERTVARYLRRIRRHGDPARRWLAFLQNHREVIVALDFFTVPSVWTGASRCGCSRNFGRSRAQGMKRGDQNQGGMAPEVVTQRMVRERNVRSASTLDRVAALPVLVFGGRDGQPHHLA
ncbi:MAG: hypothetical protein ABFD89_28165 [Bryobacteraceae bacterium]